MKSRTVRHSFPSDKRSPLPSCCRKIVRDSVGLKKRTVSTSGISIPSLYRSTTKINFISPDKSFALALALSLSEDPEVSAIEGSVPSGTILQIEDDTDLEIEVEIKEKDIYKVKEGQEVEITSEVLSEVAAKGVVSKVYQFTSTGQQNNTMANALNTAASSSSNYKAIIKVTDSAGLLLGMKVKVKISMDDEQTVFAVPYTAVMETSTGSYVYVAQYMSGMYMVQRKEVETGDTGDYYTEITGGDLEPDDYVISYPDMVSENDIISISEQGVTGTDATPGDSEGE